MQKLLLMQLKNINPKSISILRKRFNRYVEKLQDKITSKIGDLDPEARLTEDLWKREGGGGGRTRVIENGAIFAIFVPWDTTSIQVTLPFHL